MMTKQPQKIMMTKKSCIEKTDNNSSLLLTKTEEGKTKVLSFIKCGNSLAKKTNYASKFSK